jgi:Leucine-rich repeat (LRR) protein
VQKLKFENAKGIRYVKIAVTGMDEGYWASICEVKVFEQADVRSWTDSTGKYTIQAEFVEFKDGKVRLKKQNGKEVAIPIEKLSDAGRKLVQSKGKPAAENPPRELTAETVATGANASAADQTSEKAIPATPQRPEQQILGRWEPIDKAGAVIEFFKDGSAVVCEDGTISSPAKWHFSDDGQLKLVTTFCATGTVKVDGDTLTTQYGLGSVGKFKKVASFRSPALATDPTSDEVITAIRKLGGLVLATRDENSPSKPVIEVILSRTKVTDADLDHLKGLRQLQKLDISRTQVTDNGLEHLTGLTQLRVLNLFGTQMTGAGLKHLKGLTQLQMLTFRLYTLTDADLEHFKDLTQLQELWLSNTKVTDAGLEHLKDLARLRVLDLSGTQVTGAGFEHLKGLKQLRDLYLMDTQVTGAGFEHLKGLTQLQNLCLLKTQVTDAGLEHLKGMTQLQNLNLGLTKVSDSGLEHISGFTQLRELWLSSSKVTDTGLEQLKGMTQLRVLHLTNTQVTDAALEHFTGWTQLRELNLRGTQVTQEGVKKLQQALPGCTIQH